MVLSFAAFSGTGCRTSQCSTILPSRSRKISAPAMPRSSGDIDEVVGHNQIAFGNDAIKAVADWINASAPLGVSGLC